MSTKRSMAADLISAVETCTRDWTRTIEKEERNPVSRRYRFERVTRELGIQFKETAWEIMEDAYNKASGQGTYPASADHVRGTALHSAESGQAAAERVFHPDPATNFVQRLHGSDRQHCLVPIRRRPILCRYLLLYAARPYIQQKVGKPLQSAYFTQTLLPTSYNASMGRIANIALYRFQGGQSYAVICCCALCGGQSFVGSSA
jgi:hypothetical protein